MIIVTGVSGGIGKEVARELSRLDRVVGIYNNGVPDEALNKIITMKKLILAYRKVSMILLINTGKNYRKLRLFILRRSVSMG